MYKNQFDKELSNNIFYNAYMFYGQSDYLVDSYSKNIANILANKDEVTKIYFDEYNFKSCKDFLSQSSLFSPTNILLIKTNKKIPKKEVDELISICNINSASKVVFSCVGDTDFRTMAKSFTKKTNSVEVRFFEPFESEAISILATQVAKKNLQCNYGELQYLYNMHHKDLALCINDLEKLSILDEPITINTINKHCFGMGNVSFEEFLYKLFRGENINYDLYMILQEGMNEVNLITQTISFVNELFTIHIYLKLYGELNIKEIWGFNLPAKIAQTRASIARRFGIEDFKEFFNFFSNLELELKTKAKYFDTNSYVQSHFRNFSAKLR